MTHVDQVEAYFHDPRPYLQRSYNIRLRREIVFEMVGAQEPHDVLDIGCGDGSLSLQLLREKTNLLLLDLSEEMLAVARSGIPRGLEGNVRTINGDLMKTELSNAAFDLILCMGVLAHVDSPSDFIRRICSLLEPGGSIVATVSCGRHPVGQMRKLYLRLKDAVRPPVHRVKWLAARDVLDTFASQGVFLRKSFRYNFPAPGMDRLISNESLYRAIRNRHGNVANNTRAWLGDEYIVWLVKDGRQRFLP